MTIADEQATMKKAFALVCPTRRGAHWKAAVNQIVTAAELREAGVSIEQVLRSVAFMTATEAKALPLRARVALGCSANETAPDYVVQAGGYWAGPAN